MKSRVFPVAVCVIDILIMIGCLVAIAVNLKSRHPGDTIFFSSCIILLSLINVIAIIAPNAPSYLSLKIKRKSLEEQRRIDEMVSR